VRVVLAGTPYIGSITAAFQAGVGEEDGEFQERAMHERERVVKMSPKGARYALL